MKALHPNTAVLRPAFTHAGDQKPEDIASAELESLEAAYRRIPRQDLLKPETQEELGTLREALVRKLELAGVKSPGNTAACLVNQVYSRVYRPEAVHLLAPGNNDRPKARVI